MVKGSAGTIKYFAPEIVKVYKNEPKVIYGRKTDIWAAGMVLYELATSKHPFPAKNVIDY